MARPLESPRQAATRRYRRIALWCLVAMLTASLVLPLTGYLYVGIRDAHAQAVTDKNPISQYWRAVREGEAGFSAVRGPESNVLINGQGQNWRQIRDGLVANYMGWFLGAALLLVLLYFAIHGRTRLEGGRSGEKVHRWNIVDRFVHWYTATLFFILGVTGLSFLFGRVVLIPWMGKAGFAAWASFAKGLHNWAGPLFSAGVVLMILLWIRHNIPTSVDFKWFMQGGGLLGKSHPSAGFSNGGEKLWFWFITIGGGAVIVSGYFLDFPNWNSTRDTMQLANLVHGVLAVVWISIWFGHAYLGLVGSEGALEGMTGGYVDANWAKQHHDLWYEEQKKKGSESRAVAGEGESAAVKGSPA